MNQAKKSSRKSIQALVFSLLLLPFAHSLQGQEHDSLGYKSAYIQSMKHLVALDLSFTNKVRRFKVESGAKIYEIYPNTPNHLRFEGNYSYLSFGVQWSPDFLPGNGDNKLKGNTRAFSIGSSILMEKWLLELNYHLVRGFYLHNTASFQSWQPGQAYIQFPEQRHEGFNLRFGHIFNPHFSYRSLHSQTERQVRSAGSFLPFFQADYYAFDDQSKSLNSQGSQNLEILLYPGYSYTFVYRENFYLNLSAHGGGAYLHTWLLTRASGGDLQSTQDNWALGWELSSSIGYNAKKWYGGLRYESAQLSFNQNQTTVRSTEDQLAYYFFLGYRFKAPTWLEKPVNDWQERFPWL